MSEYLERLARRGAGDPGPTAVAPPETISAVAFDDTDGALDEAGAQRGGDRVASTPRPAPVDEHADGGATATPSLSPPHDRSAASGSTAEVTEASPVAPPRRRPYEGADGAISRHDAGGEVGPTPNTGAAQVSTAAAQSGREADAGRASAAGRHRSTRSAPSDSVDRAGPAMAPARRSGPSPPAARSADVAATPAEIGSESSHTTEPYPGRGGLFDSDADAPGPPRFATEPHVETEPHDAPTASPEHPDPQAVLGPASAVVAMPPAPAPVPQAPAMHPTGPEVSVSIGRITVQTEAPHPTPTELPRSPQRSHFSSMTLARRHVDRRWY